MDSGLTRAQLVHWRTAIFTIFMATGFEFGSWASRMPAVKHDLEVDDFGLGALLFVIGASSLFGLSAANLLVARWGVRRSLALTITTLCTGIVLAGASIHFVHSYALAAISLAILGFGMSATDVLMNVEAAAVEQSFGKTLMPLFHAFFSLGTVAGAGIGVLMAAWGIGVGWHLGVIGLLLLAIGCLALTAVPVRDAVHDDATRPSRRERFAEIVAVWRDPRTHALGVIMLGMAFAEGSANDWLAVAVVDGRGQAEALGAVALAVFSTAMTAVRLFGGPLVDRVGRVWSLRMLAVLAAVGLSLFILAPTLPVAFAGIALWGAGTALGFPIGMSAAADDPSKAAASVSAAATIGYLAFLCGPPVLGWISHQIGILPTLWIIVGLIAMSGIASGAARPIAGSPVGAGHARAH
ncbi:MAG: MFS transporter [Microbacterium sp.]